MTLMTEGRLKNLPSVILGIQIHSPGQQFNWIIYIESFADKEGFTVFRANQRAEVTVTSFHFLQESLGADARLKLFAFRIEKLGTVSIDCVPFALALLANVHNERWRNSSRKQKVRNAVWPPSFLPGFAVVFCQPGDVHGFADKFRCMRVVRMRVVPVLGKNNSRPQLS